MNSKWNKIKVKEDKKPLDVYKLKEKYNRKQDFFLLFLKYHVEIIYFNMQYQKLPKFKYQNWFFLVNVDLKITSTACLKRALMLFQTHTHLVTLFDTITINKA